MGEHQRVIPQRLTEAQAAEELGISLGSLRNLRKDGKIGYVRILNKVYHLPEQVAAYFNTQIVDPCHQTTPANQDISKATGSNRSQDATRGSGTGHGTTSEADRSAESALVSEFFRRRTKPSSNGS